MLIYFINFAMLNAIQPACSRQDHAAYLANRK